MSFDQSQGNAIDDPDYRKSERKGKRNNKKNKKHSKHQSTETLMPQSKKAKKSDIEDDKVNDQFGKQYYQMQKELQKQYKDSKIFSLSMLNQLQSNQFFQQQLHNPLMAPMNMHPSLIEQKF